AMGLEMPTAQGASLMPTLRERAPIGRDSIFAEANWHDYEQFSRAVRTGRFKLVRNYYWDTPLWHPADSVNSITWEAFLELDATGRLTPAQRYLMQPKRPFEELYDLTRDPDELTSVVDDPAYREDLARLRTRLDRWREETDDRMPAERRRDAFNRDGEPLPHNQPPP
ncbi:MAG: heparan N-sulfatase, partial [Dehalococcoidia bacterium]|nr:heparan N-sulfatase [Dehalococcoidia bacterium]